MWAEIASWGFRFVAAQAIGTASVLAPQRLRERIRAQELVMLYDIATQGPGGFDDAVQMRIVRSATRYSGAVVRLLATQDSRRNHEVGLYFAEFVAGDPRVRQVLAALSLSHSDAKTREYCAHLLTI